MHFVLLRSLRDAQVRLLLIVSFWSDTYIDMAKNSIPQTLLGSVPVVSIFAIAAFVYVNWGSAIFLTMTI